MKINYRKLSPAVRDYARSHGLSIAAVVRRMRANALRALAGQKAA